MKHHAQEICRWASCPDGTLVWTRIGALWTTVSAPSWNPYADYVVNDGEAEKRKRQIEKKLNQKGE